MTSNLFPAEHLNGQAAVDRVGAADGARKRASRSDSNCGHNKGAKDEMPRLDRAGELTVVGEVNRAGWIPSTLFYDIVLTSGIEALWTTSLQA
ncbi:hypothetical protein E4U55_004544 [Claviceps digitariae]|nr:hypothetical protein E4U55_004544 [Claviceps digitariae]